MNAKMLRAAIRAASEAEPRFAEHLTWEQKERVVARLNQRVYELENLMMPDGSTMSPSELYTAWQEAEKKVARLTEDVKAAREAFRWMVERHEGCTARDCDVSDFPIIRRARDELAALSAQREGPR